MNGFRWLAVLVAVFIPAGASAGDGQIDLLQWLEGSWERETKYGVSVESWSRVSDVTMEGVVTVRHGEELIVTETSRLERFGEDLFYVTRPRENAFPTAFRLVEYDDRRFVFQNPSHDFPQQILYRRVGDHSLVVEISRIGDPESIAFEFARVAP